MRSPSDSRTRSPKPKPAPRPLLPRSEAGAAPPEDDFDVPYEETVVAASRRAQSTLDAPNSITVITGDEIRASGLLSLADILRRVPGAEVMTMGLDSANVSFRGFNQRIANKVLLLIDGRPEYQDFLGVTLWSVLPVGLEEIERVEVIRGPGSALYGANAMLGVVNIITRSPGTGAPAEFNGLAGNAQPRRRQLRGVGRRQGALPRLGRLPAGRQVQPRLRARSSRRPLEHRRPQPGAAHRAREPHRLLRLQQRLQRRALRRRQSPFTELYALGLLRNYYLDGVGGYAKADVTAGPVKFRFFWNHATFDAGPQYEPIGQRSLTTSVDTNVFDGEALFQKELSLAGTHVVAVGSERAAQARELGLHRAAHRGAARRGLRAGRVAHHQAADAGGQLPHRSPPAARQGPAGLRAVAASLGGGAALREPRLSRELRHRLPPADVPRELHGHSHPGARA